MTDVDDQTFDGDVKDEAKADAKLIDESFRHWLSATELHRRVAAKRPLTRAWTRLERSAINVARRLADEGLVTLEQKLTDETEAVVMVRRAKMPRQKAEEILAEMKRVERLMVMDYENSSWRMGPQKRREIDEHRSAMRAFMLEHGL